MNNIIKVNFNNNEPIQFATGLTQWDNGIILKVAGLDLDANAEVHFALTETAGAAKRQIATVEDNILTTIIPGYILQAEKTFNYEAYAFIYLSNADAAKTEKKIVLKIEARPKPDEWLPPDEPDTLQQLLAEISKKQDKEDGKGLSSNDFTDNLKNKLEKMPSNDEIKEEFNKKADKTDSLSGYGIKDAYTKKETDTKLSKKANSGTTLESYGIENAYNKEQINKMLDSKAAKGETLAEYGITDAYTKTETAEAINKAKAETEEFTKNHFANTLKATASGEIIRVDDVSPIEHTAKAKVSGKNLFNIDEGLNEYLVKNEDGTYTITRRTNRFSEYVSMPIKANTTVTVSCVGMLDEGFRALTFQFEFTDGTTAYANMTSKVKSYVHTFNKDVRRARIYLLPDAVEGDYKTFTGIQLELGDTATEYEPYIDPATVTVTVYGEDETESKAYTPAADGTCEITSVSPTMTILTDTAGVNIDVEYNQDTNAAMGNVKADIETLDNDMAVLKGDMGDVETALDNIIAIQTSLIGGVS